MTNDPLAPIADAISEFLSAIAGWLSIGFGLLGVLGAVVGVAGRPESLPIATAIFCSSVAFVALGVLVLPRYRNRLARRRSIIRLGPVRTVDRQAVRASDARSGQCVDCGTTVDKGLVRRYREELFVAGIPVSVRRDGTTTAWRVRAVRSRPARDTDTRSPDRGAVMTNEPTPG